MSLNRCFVVQSESESRSSTTSFVLWTVPLVLESFFVLDLASAAAFLARARSWWDLLALHITIDLSSRNCTLYWRGPICSPNCFEASSVKEQCSKSMYDKNLSQFPHFQRCPLGDLFRSKKLSRPKHWGHIKRSKN